MSDVEKYRELGEQAGFITSKNEYGHQDLRAGTADRSQTLKALADARVQGRLTEAQWHSRMELVDLASSQTELRLLLRDLPPPPPKVDAIDKVSGWGKNAHRRHPHVTHAGITFGSIAGIVFSWVGPLVGGTGMYGDHGNSPWLVLPILVTIFGVVWTAISTALWVDCDEI